MSETKKITRRFLLTVIWVLFILLTLSGVISAGEKTEYVNSGKEQQTVKINNNLSLRSNGKLRMENGKFRKCFALDSASLYSFSTFNFQFSTTII